MLVATSRLQDLKIVTIAAQNQVNWPFRRLLEHRNSVDCDIPTFCSHSARSEAKYKRVRLYAESPAGKWKLSLLRRHGIRELRKSLPLTGKAVCKSEILLSNIDPMM